MTDAARSAMDQHSLAGLQMPVVEEPLPRRQRGERHRRGFDVREPRRLGCGLIGFHEHVFRVTAAIDAAEHCIEAITVAEGIYPGTGTLDRPGQIAAERHRQHLATDPGHGAAADLVIDRIDAGRMDAHQQFVISWLGDWDVIQFEYFRTTKAMDAYCLHCTPPSISGYVANRRQSIEAAPPDIDARQSAQILIRLSPYCHLSRRRRS